MTDVLYIAEELERPGLLAWSKYIRRDYARCIRALVKSESVKYSIEELQERGRKYVKMASNETGSAAMGFVRWLSESESGR